MSLLGDCPRRSIRDSGEPNLGTKFGFSARPTELTETGRPVVETCAHAQFESCTPSEKRYTHHKVLRLSHFEPSVSRAGSDAAFFSVPGNMPGYMPLDELEEFGTTLLA